MNRLRSAAPGQLHHTAHLRIANAAPGEPLPMSESPALEMAGDVLKALFDPTACLAPSEHPADAFMQIALHLRSTN
jgi:hypothetical protein